jgi:hypothetical protein
MSHHRGAKTDAILWREAAHRDVHGMVGEQDFGATGEAPEAEARATGFQSLAFTSKVSACAGLLRGGRRRDREESEKRDT